MSKFFIPTLLAVAVSCASAGHLVGYGPAAAISTGTSSQFRSEDNHGNYQFGYDEQHSSGSSGRREERSGDVVRGSYRLGDADGRQRTVNYVADASGFHATIQTNEPGVDPTRDPADVLINKEPAALVGPAPLVPAPLAPLPLAPAGPLPAAPIFRAPVYAAATKTSVIAQAPIEAPPAPRAFSYSFDASHPALSFVAPPAPVLEVPAPIVQQGIKY